MGIPGVGALEHLSAAAERRQRGEVRAGGGAEQADALGVDAELPGTGAHELHGREHIVHGLRKHFLALLRKPVADREQGIASFGEIGAPELESAARTRLPSAAVHGDERRDASCARRQIEIAKQRNAIVIGIADTGPGFDLLRFSHQLRPGRSDRG